MTNTKTTYQIENVGLTTYDDVPTSKTAKVTKKYSDLNLDFHAHPVSKDIVPLTDSEAVKRSVRNLLLTNYNERCFNPSFGSNLKSLLFEPVNDATTYSIKTWVSNAIDNFDPRASLIDVIVNPSIDENAYAVTIVYVIDNISESVTQEIFLERLR